MTKLVGVVSVAVVIGAIVELVVPLVRRVLVLPSAMLVAPVLRVVPLRAVVIVVFFRFVFFIKVVSARGISTVTGRRAANGPNQSIR